MFYDDSFEKAGEHLRSALKYLSETRIPPDPINYTVWYNFVSGKNKKLSDIIKAMLTGEKEITIEDCRKWYESYIINNETMKADRIIQDFRQMMTELYRFISKSGTIYPEYTASLKAHMEALDGMENIDDITDILKHIIKDTETVAASTMEVENRFQAVQEEVETLRNELRSKNDEATTDPLTGLLNRRGLEDSLGQMIHDANHELSSFSIIMLDIDHFKSINDTYGHLVGDNVLQIVSHLITDSIKGKDIAARFGGEEFLILLPSTPLIGGVMLAEKIRKQFERFKWRNKASNTSIGQIRVSAGVSAYRNGETSESIIQRADKALYYSKENGRNRVTSEKQLKKAGSEEN